VEYPPGHGPELPPGRGGPGVGAAPHLDGAAAGRERRRHHALDVQIREQQRDAHHVSDGVVRADLVEVRLFEIGSVDACLGLAEELEYRQCVLAWAVVDVEGLDDLDDVGVVAVGPVALGRIGLLTVVVGNVVVTVMVVIGLLGPVAIDQDVDASCRDPLPVGRRDRIAHSQGVLDRLEDRPVRAGGEQGAKQHVPARAHSAVEPQRSHARSEGGCGVKGWGTGRTGVRVVDRPQIIGYPHRPRQT
jgi:hypothetical protein